MKTTEELAASALDRMQHGQTIVLSDTVLDAMVQADMANNISALDNLRTLPNPDRVGMLDKYVGWIGDLRPQPRT